MSEQKVLDLSWSTVLKIALAVIFFYILFQIKDIIVWFIFALIISILFNPAIDFLKKFKIPRVVSTCLIYFLVFGLLSVVFYSAVVALVTEVEQLSQILPHYLQELSPTLREIGVYALEDIESFINEIRGSLRELSGAFFSVLFSVFGGIFTTFFVLTMAFFLSLEGRIVERAMVALFPKKYEEYSLVLWKRCQKKVSSWFATRILVCLFVGIATYISCLILAVKYPFSLGLVAGVANFIPYIGPLISGSFIFAITAADGLAKGFFILIVFVLIQLIESSVLTPVLSHKFIGLSPVLVIMALAIGGVLWGALGALLAIPLAGILFEFLKEFFEKRKKEEQALESSEA